MSTTIPPRLDETPEQPDSAGVARSEPGGRARMQGMAYEIGGGSPDLGP